VIDFRALPQKSLTLLQRRLIRKRCYGARRRTVKHAAAKAPGACGQVMRLALMTASRHDRRDIRA